MPLRYTLRLTVTGRLAALVMLASATMLVAIPAAHAAALPALPLTFDVPYVPPSGKTIVVDAGGDFQAALNSAELGDTIVLQAGATYSGPFTLPNKSPGSGWIYVQSSAYANLPAPGTRVRIADSANMPKVQVARNQSAAAIRTADNAHHYRFVGIELKPVTGQFVYNLVDIGNADTSVSTLPSYIVFDRCYIHGDPIAGGRRGVKMDGRYIAVVDSHVSDFKETGADTQALWANNTPGPLKVVNNYLEAAGENLLTGGSDNRIKDVVPADIEIRGNHFFKPLTWRSTSPPVWTVKNLIEFKNARRVLVQGNRFENHWGGQGQSGFSFLITPRNQYGTDPNNVTEDITVTDNVLVNVAAGFNISGEDGSAGTVLRTKRVLVRNNFIETTGMDASGGATASRFPFQLIGGPTDVTIDHNTVLPASILVYSESAATKTDGLVLTNNIVTRAGHMYGSGTNTANTTLATYHTTNFTIVKNVNTEGASSHWPAGNYFPARVEDIRFMDAGRGNFRLAPDSPFKSAGTDGKDLGADFDRLEAAGGVGRQVAPAAPSVVRAQ